MKTKYISTQEDNTEEYELFNNMGSLIGTIKIYNSESHKITLFGTYNEMRKYFWRAYQTAMKIYAPAKQARLWS